LGGHVHHLVGRRTFDILHLLNMVTGDDARRQRFPLI
jgi:hypothetical protein